MARITVEDCLRNENNRFTLVHLATKRTKQLLSGSRPRIDDTRGNKPVVVALREIADGGVRFMSAEDRARIRAVGGDEEGHDSHGYGSPVANVPAYSIPDVAPKRQTFSSPALEKAEDLFDKSEPAKSSDDEDEGDED